MANLLTLSGIAFSLDVMPAFVPSTWIVISWVGFSRSEADPMIFVGVTTCVATVGRLVLARFPCLLVRNCWMRRADRQNIDVVCVWPEDRKGATVSLMLAYALSPFPSNYIFIAYGLTGTRSWLTGLPFFVGRWVGYLTWTHIAQIDTRYLDEETEIDGAYMGVYFVVSQVVFLVLIYGFARPDWQYSLQTKHLR